MMADIDFLVAKLGRITGFDDTGDVLANMIKGKQVEQQPAPSSESDDDKADGKDSKDSKGSDSDDKDKDESADKDKDTDKNNKDDA